MCSQPHCRCVWRVAVGCFARVAAACLPATAWCPISYHMDLSGSISVWWLIRAPKPPAVAAMKPTKQKGASKSAAEETAKIRYTQKCFCGNMMIRAYACTHVRVRVYAGVVHSVSLQSAALAYSAANCQYWTRWFIVS